MMPRYSALVCVAASLTFSLVALVAAPPKSAKAVASKPKPVRPEPHAGPLTPEELTERKREVLRGRNAIRDYLFKKSGVKHSRPKLTNTQRLKITTNEEVFAPAGGDTRKIYGLVAQQLRLAEAVLDQEDADAARTGLWRFQTIFSYAGADLKDRELAWMIAECWLLGSLDQSPQNTNHPLSRRFLYGLTMAAARDAQKFERMEYLAHEMELTSTNPNTVNAARWHRSAALESLGRHQDAIEVLKTIPNDSSFVNVKQRIPILEKIVAEQSKEKAPNPSESDSK